MSDKFSTQLYGGFGQETIYYTCSIKGVLAKHLTYHSDLLSVEYTKGKHLYRILVPSAHILLSFCITKGAFDRSRVFGLVQVFWVPCILVIGVCVQRANVDHCG